LYQNIPNPFSKSTYIRFNLPWAAQIELTVTDKLSGAVKYDYRDSRQAGYYQIYLNNLVTEKQLRNGIYKYKLTAKNSSGKTFSAENEMLVISDSSEANWITNSNGNYFFGFDETFDGDTVITTSDGGYYYPTVLTNTVNLEIKRRGYASQLINVTLYPDINLQRDIVLDKEVQQ
ncbi:MAG TPA: hypothetical protein VJ954_01350, partial [Ignavibacteriaceae bacterium]|nr:hypothetical protein [Ignavibacteriaceae bacterium]